MDVVEKSNLRFLFLISIVFTFIESAVIWGDKITSPTIVNLCIQILLFLTFLFTISYRGYYFNKGRGNKEFLKKFISFGLLLLPFGLTFWSNGLLQIIVFFASIIISLSYCLAYQVTFKMNEKHTIILFFLTCSIIPSITLFLPFLKILPAPLNQWVDKHSDILKIILFINSRILFLSYSLMVISKGIRAKPIWKPIRRKPWKPAIYSNPKKLILKQFLNSFLKVIVTVINFIVTTIIINTICRWAVFIFDVFVRILKSIIESKKLYKNLLAIISFGVFYLICILILFIINNYIESLIQYLRGVDIYFQDVLIMSGYLLALSLCFKLFVITAFTRLNIMSSESIFKFFQKKSNNSFEDIFLVAIILLFSALITHFIIWVLYIVFPFQNFNFLGYFTKLTLTLLVIGAVVAIVLELRNSKRKESETIEESEEYLFEFIYFDWGTTITKFLYWSGGLLLISTIIFLYSPNISEFLNSHLKTKNENNNENQHNNYLPNVKGKNPSVQYSERTTIIIDKDTLESPKSTEYHQKDLTDSITRLHQDTRENEESNESLIAGKPSIVEKENNSLPDSLAKSKKKNWAPYTPPPAINPSKIVVTTESSSIKDRGRFDNSPKTNRFANDSMVFVTEYSESDTYDKDKYSEPNPYGKGKGRIIFWTDCKDCIWKIYIKGIYAGKATYWKEELTACNSRFSLNIDLPAGMYDCSAIETSGSTLITKEFPAIRILLGECMKIKIPTSRFRN